MIRGWGKKIISVLCMIAVLCSLLGCAASQEETGTLTSGSDKRIKIGVSIWNTVDLMGSKTRTLIEEAADALGVEVIWCEHDYNASWVRTSVNRLCAQGCDGILFCPTQYDDMRDAIRTCDREGVYLVQYYSRLLPEAESDLYQLSVDSSYYVGSVFEDEQENGYNLIYYLLNKGDRRIGVMCGDGDEINFKQRLNGCQLAVDEWNTANPDDKVYLSRTVTARSDYESCDAAVDEILSMMRDMDGLFVGSGNGNQVMGAMGALRDHELTADVDLVGTGFLNDMETQLRRGGICAQSGGNTCNSLYAFLMVYKAVKGDLKKVPGQPGSEIMCSYIYISSPEEYAEYEKYFLTTLPYSKNEIRDLAGYNLSELAVAADILSVRDVRTRHSEKYILKMKEGKRHA